MKYKKIIIWGHPLHSHTHSYIHQAFFRAFKSLGYDTCWFDDSTDVSSFDFSDALFLTEGQACSKMPIIKGCSYILHNCYDEQMWSKINAEDVNYLKLQVYTDDVLNYEDAKLIEPCIYYDKPGKILYMPWSTDLLPHEINPDIYQERVNKSYWVGSMGDGIFGNNPELSGFIRACNENGIEFKHANNLSIEDNRRVVAESYLSPAIVGSWQKRHGYIPCRIFKNISYNQFGITNSARVNELFEGKLVYSENEYDLFGLMQEKMKSPTYEQELVDLITFVKEKHTYLNRINTLLSCL